MAGWQSGHAYCKAVYAGSIPASASNNIMKIAIIGYGFVGQALEMGLKKNVEVFKVDPKLNTYVKDLKYFKPDVIFICVPTPMNDDLSQDISILEKVISQLTNLDMQALIVLKSTVLPIYINKIQKLIPNFIYNPEFLREKHANEDFVNSNLIVFGGGISMSKRLASFYKNYTKCLCTDYVFTDALTASFIKYTINSYLATKVIFFNELKQLFDKAELEESWTNFISFLSRDARLGNSHMDVPGHDGRLGFGGACLPKDSNAFMTYADSIDISLGLLKNAINTNNKIRSEYNTKTDRENEQNINFKGEKNN